MNRKRIARLTRDLGQLTTPEISMLVLELRVAYGGVVTHTITSTLHNTAMQPDAALASVLATNTGVFMTAVGEKKIVVIKTLREHLGLALREAKELTEVGPVLLSGTVAIPSGKAFLPDLDKARTLALLKALQAAGATVELR